MQTVYHAANTVEAHIVAGLLRANGIGAWVGGHYLQGAVGELPPSALGRIEVDDADVSAARRILDDYESGRLMAPDDADE